jgi:hypothetical protein
MGTRQLCPQHEQRTEANSDHLRRLQRPEVFGADDHEIPYLGVRRDQVIPYPLDQRFP